MPQPRMFTTLHDRVTSSISVESEEDQLLDLYLSLPVRERDQRFVCTKCAAESTGLSVRTIQFWIECGYVQAIFIGRKYRVDLDSLREYLKQQMRKRQES